jgi:hypothetical protein
MTTVYLKEFEESFVIHFGLEGERINAYTLASTLVNFADAAKAANSALNPGYEVEVLVEALGAGSFKAKVRTVYREAGNLFSKQSLHAIVLSVIANFIYQHTLAPNTPINITVNSSEAVIQHGDTTVIVPREVHDATNSLEGNQRFRTDLENAIRTLERDPTITSFGFSASPTESTPALEIPRDRFQMIQAAGPELGPSTREVIETTDLEILRAILERSKRRWQFAWGGVRIAAPVLDDRFYDRFVAHEVTVAPGDRLNVRLRIKQKLSPVAGVYVNQSYEVVEVIGHIPKSKQTRLNLGHQ